MAVIRNQWSGLQGGDWLLIIMAGFGSFGLGFGADHLIGDVKAGDRLAFAGALFGAAAAVVGSSIVSARQRGAERREARAYQYELLTRIRENVGVITADFRPNPDDAHAFNAQMRAIPVAIRAIKRDAALLDAPDVQRSAGWNVAICHVPRLVQEAEPGFLRFDDQDIKNGNQPALAVAMSQAIGELTPVRMQVENCLIDLKPRFGPPRR